MRRLAPKGSGPLAVPMLRIKRSRCGGSAGPLRSGLSGHYGWNTHRSARTWLLTLREPLTKVRKPMPKLTKAPYTFLSPCLIFLLSGCPPRSNLRATAPVMPSAESGTYNEKSNAKESQLIDSQRPFVPSSQPEKPLPLIAEPQIAKTKKPNPTKPIAAKKGYNRSSSRKQESAKSSKEAPPKSNQTKLVLVDPPYPPQQPPTPYPPQQPPTPYPPQQPPTIAQSAKKVSDDPKPNVPIESEGQHPPPVPVEQKSLGFWDYASIALDGALSLSLAAVGTAEIISGSAVTGVRTLQLADQVVPSGMLPTPPPTPPTPPTPPPQESPPENRRNPNQTCDDTYLTYLQKLKNDITQHPPEGTDHCNPNNRSPKRIARQPCSKVRKRIAWIRSCIQIRDRIQYECFGDKPDQTHEGTIDDWFSNLNQCLITESVNCAKGHPMADL